MLFFSSARALLVSVSSRRHSVQRSLAIGLLMGCAAVGMAGAQILSNVTCSSTHVLNTGALWQVAAASSIDYPDTPPAWASAVTSFRLDNSDWRWIDAYTPDAQWIAVNADGSNPGTYTYYRYAFNLDDAVDPASFSIALSYHVDDRLDAIYVNGQAQPVPALITWDSSGGRPFLTQEHGPHTLASDWTTGANEVILVVWNAGGPSGILTQGAIDSCVTQTAIPSATTPVPVNGIGALALLSIMVAGIAGRKVRCRRCRQ